MVNQTTYTLRIVVLIAVLALLLGLILGGIFSIVRNCSDSDSIVIFDSVYGSKVIDNSPVLLSEIDYPEAGCKCKGVNPKPGTGSNGISGTGMGTA